MAKLKTRPTRASAKAFLASLADDRRRSDCRRLAKMMTEVTGAPAVMWGSSIVGFGTWRYRYESGREGDWFLAGFSPRSRELVVYVMDGLDRHEARLARLGPHKRGKSCLYLKSLADVDVKELEALIQASVHRLRRSATDR